MDGKLKPLAMIASQNLIPDLKTGEPTANPSQDPRRLDGVDVLRGLAILFVVLNHVNMRLVLADIPYATGVFRKLIACLVWNGQFGVQIFFAVSGFLITTTALRRWGTLANVSLKGFYRLRFARIVPMLLALIAVMTALHYGGVGPYVVSQETGGIGRAVFAALTFHMNVLQARRGWLPGNWGVLWSLSVEEVFYLFFPLVARFLGRSKMLVVVLLCFVAIGPFARTVLAGGNDVWADQSYLGGMDAIALGCLTALLARRVHFSRTTLRVLVAVGSMLMLFILVGLRVTSVLVIGRSGLDMTILAVGTCLVIVAAAQTKWKAPGAIEPLLWLGRCSYEVYLTHMFVIFTMFGIFVHYGKPMWAVPVLFAVSLVVTTVVGEVVARYFSEPVNRRLREYWARAGTTAL